MPNPPAAKLRVLVVEDDAATLTLAVELLELLGHWAAGVTSAEAAMSRFLEGAFDVLLIDLNLPGLSGMELAERLRRRESLPVIFASGDDPTEQELPPGTCWLPKPYTTRELGVALAHCK